MICGCGHGELWHTGKGSACGACSCAALDRGFDAHPVVAWLDEVAAQPSEGDDE